MKSPHKKSKKLSLMEEFIDDMLWEEAADEGAQSSQERRQTDQIEKEGSDKLLGKNIPDIQQGQDSVSHSIESSEKESHIDRPFNIPALNAAESLLQQMPERHDFLEPEIDFDERLSQVQALLAKMPKVHPDQVESNPTDQTKFDHRSEQANIQTEQLWASSNDNKSELNAEIKAESKEQDLDVSVATELLEQDVSREVTRLRELLGDRFQTLIFDVGNLPLAVPLAKLGGIHTYSQEDITPIFGTPDWFEGLIPAEQGNIMLVDTAKLIMPEKYEQIKDQLDYKYAILLDDTRWALACSTVREAKTLELDDIRWSEKGTKKEWFAGMVVQFMCALLEVDALINLLYRKGKEQKNS